MERGGREEESCFDEVERERELMVRVLLLPKGCFKSSFASFFSLDRQRTSSIDGLSGPRARNAKNRGVLEEKEEEDKKQSMASIIGFAFCSRSLSFAPALTRRAARPRPSSTGGVRRPLRGEMVYRGGDIWEEREGEERRRRGGRGELFSSASSQVSFVTPPFLSPAFLLSCISRAAECCSCLLPRASKGEERSLCCRQL